MGRSGSIGGAPRQPAARHMAVPRGARCLAGMRSAAGFFLDRARLPEPRGAGAHRVVLAGYSVLTWTGMLVFGREAWLRHGELFSVVFGIACPLRADRSAGARAGDLRDVRSALQQARRTLHRLPRLSAPRRLAAMDARAAPIRGRTLDSRPVSTSMTAFVLLVLSTLYDGVLGTPEWTGIEIRSLRSRRASATPQ